jgi:hypothetical protein
MLGNLIGEQKGKISGIRVLSDGKTEITDQATAKFWGVDVNFVVTFNSTARPDGTFFGEGQGFITSKDGDVVSFKGSGVGLPKGKGWAASYRGAVFYQTTSPKFAAANKTCGIFEYEIDENGNTSAKTYEWK